MLTDRLFRTASFRLSVLYGAIFIVCFAMLLFITYWTATAALRDQIRTKITEDTQALAAEAATDGTRSVVQDIEERLKYAGSDVGYYFISDKQGLKLAGNLNHVKMQSGWQEAPLIDFVAVRSGDNLDEDHELWGKGIRLPDGAFLFAGQDAFRVLSVQEAIIEAFAWAAGIAFLLAAVAGIAASQGFLRQIDAINTTSLAIIDGRLKERIPVRGTSDEIDRLSMNLNRLLDSNQALLESLKQVSTDIAHDLRTPLSRLRQGLEEARQKSGKSKSHEKAIESAISEADQLLATFSALLRIAQIESGSRKAGFKTFDLTALVERIASAYSAVAEDQGKELSVTLSSNIIYQGDAELILQMVANLLENAIRHTPPQTRITLGLTREPSGIVAVLSDSGPGIPPELREKVFERFFRLDASRATDGNGLGLALVHAVAVLHGIRISLQDNGPGLRVTLSFPPP